MPSKTSGSGSDRKSPHTIRLTQIRIQGIIYSTEEPSKVYTAIEALLPNKFTPLETAITTDLDAPKPSREYDVTRALTKGYYKDTIELLELQLSKATHIEALLSYWAGMLSQPEKCHIKEVLERQLSNCDPEPTMDIYLRIDRFFALAHQLAILSSELVRALDDPRDPGSSIQVRLHFERPYSHQKALDLHTHPYYTQFIEFFTARRLIA